MAKLIDIPFVDLKAQYRSIKSEIDNTIQSVLEDSAFVGGKYVDVFNSEFADAVCAKHCIGVGNGTDALFIVQKMLGIGYGDEVITTATSWISTSETISQTGAIPVFVDIDPDYYTIDPSEIEDKITPKTKAIIPVHLYGQMAEMDKLTDICQRNNLYMIEDCAQANMSQYNGVNSGNFGIAGTFSFYPGKNLGAYGDAGCIVTNDDDLAERCRMFANHGQSKKHDHKFEGINSRLDGLQAAILSTKLKYLQNWIETRNKVAQKYDYLLNNNPHIILPKIRQNSRHTFHLYVIRTGRREELQLFLRNKGISTAVHYPTALPFLTAYKHINHSHEDYENAFYHQNEALSLPIYPELTDDVIEYIANVINAFSN